MPPQRNYVGIQDRTTSLIVPPHTHFSNVWCTLIHTYVYHMHTCDALLIHTILSPITGLIRYLSILLQGVQVSATFLPLLIMNLD